ncbi:hypothetical protein [Nocardia sp. NBC_01009]|uniref:hypothetical protein n=1 Tax=Nocardia sp. NBC_01009 TaxID=2975996 RepID=UPI0038672476|nr:hypothetical protein OHA42_20895 [Nocardia sp. NBC_01009]
MSTAPPLIWVLVTVGIFAVLLATASALHSSALAAGLGRRTALRISIVFGLICAAWAVTTGELAAKHVYLLDSDAVKPWLGVGFLVPFAVLLVLSRVPVVARALSHPAAQAQLIRLHRTRVMGVTFLIAMAMGELPPALALPAAFGDIAVGLAASRVARGLGRGTGVRHALWFNIFGLIDFVYAFAVTFLAGPGPTQLLHLTPSTQQMSVLPLVLIPTVGVPALFASHLISLAKLRATSPAEAVPALA